jgi:hypothetical protein
MRHEKKKALSKIRPALARLLTDNGGFGVALPDELTSMIREYFYEIKSTLSRTGEKKIN